MVDLIIRLKHLSPERMQVYDFMQTVAQVSQKYPLLEYKDGEILFDWISKCDIINSDKNGITFSTNVGLYDYMAYAVYAFADVLGIDQVYDQNNEVIPLTKLKQISQNIPLEIDLAKKSTGYPVVCRLVPQKDKNFRFMQIDRAVNTFNQNYGKELLILSEDGRRISAISADGINSLAVFYTGNNFSYLEIKKPIIEIDSFEKIIRDFAQILFADIKSSLMLH